MHQRALPSCICASLLLFAAACGGFNSPSLANAFVDAAEALEAKTGAPGEKSEMPAASDPAVQAFAEQSSKALAALGTDTLPVSGFESFEQLCGKTANVVAAYAMAGTRGTSGAAQQQRMMANAEQHLDQMFTPLLFSVHCTAEHLPFLESRVDSSDASKMQAMKEVRDGASRQLLGLLQMASDQSLDTERRRKIMELLAADSGKLAVGLSAPQRLQIFAAVGDLEGVLPDELRPDARKLSEQIARTACGKICSAR
jgi:hypothetical protein